MKKKVLLVFGTRPEAIKMAPLVKTLQQEKSEFITQVCVTGQHREMLDQVLKIFDIIPDYDLNIMKAGQDLYDITSRVILGMRDILKKSTPDLVFVHGDTTTSSITALAAYYQQIPVAHVEAGLRTNNIYSPWPEEINRQITGRITRYHFAPTETAYRNLIKENVSASDIYVTGNTVIDALRFVIDQIEESQSLKNILENQLESQLGTKVNDLGRIILVTGHRRENFGKGFLNICEALADIAIQNEDVSIIYPVHLNPNVQEPVFKLLKDHANIHLINPLSYLPFVYLMSKSFIVLTDSGGIQEEAPGLGKPVLVMRDTTERPEALEAGTVELVGTEKIIIVDKVNALLNNTEYYNKMATAINPYGDGKTSRRIVEHILRALE